MGHTFKRNQYSLVGFFFILLLLFGFKKPTKIDPMSFAFHAMLCATLIFYLCARFELKQVAIVASIACLGVITFSKFGAVSVVLCPFVGLGLVSHLLLKRIDNESGFILASVGIFLIFLAGSVALYCSVHDVNPFGSGQAYIGESLQLSKEFAQKILLTLEENPDLEEFDSRWDESIKTVPFSIPGTVMVFYSLCYFGILYAIRMFSNHITKRPASFGKFRVRHEFIFIFIAGCALEIIAYMEKNDSLRYVSRTLLIFMSSLYAAQGFVICYMFPKALRFGKLLRIIVMFLALIMFQLTVALGLFDTWFDFRKHLKRIEERTDESNLT